MLFDIRLSARILFTSICVTFSSVMIWPVKLIKKSGQRFRSSCITKINWLVLIYPALNICYYVFCIFHYLGYAFRHWLQMKTRHTSVRNYWRWRKKDCILYTRNGNWPSNLNFGTQVHNTWMYCIIYCWWLFLFIIYLSLCVYNIPSSKNCQIFARNCETYMYRVETLICPFSSF